jgi:hypothetical protein
MDGGRVSFLPLVFVFSSPLDRAFLIGVPFCFRCGGFWAEFSFSIARDSEGIYYAQRGFQFFFGDQAPFFLLSSTTLPLQSPYCPPSLDYYH